MFGLGLLFYAASLVQVDPPKPPVQLASVRRSIVVRVPFRPMMAIPFPRRQDDWKEIRGPKCIVRSSIAGASLFGTKSIDISLRDGRRLRARLKNSCPALDYYAGFFLLPTADGRICQDRDAVHTRSGGECGIDAIRQLVPSAGRARTRNRR